MPFEPQLLRWQQVSAGNGDRLFLATPLELLLRRLLPMSTGWHSQGVLVVSQADLAPFEVGDGWGAVVVQGLCALRVLMDRTRLFSDACL